jgi:hypothetical protein
LINLTDEHDSATATTLSLFFMTGLQLQGLLSPPFSSPPLVIYDGYERVDRTGHVNSHMLTQIALNTGEECVQVGWIKVSGEHYIAD